MKKTIILLAVLGSLTVQAQKKHWYDKYWLASGVQLLYGQKTGTGANLDIGKSIGKHFNVGAGYTFLAFNEVQKANVFNLYGEVYMKAKNRQLYGFVKPGLAKAHKAKEQAVRLSRDSYDGYKYGANLQIGTGMRWMIKRHAFFIQAGYNITNYSINAVEYPVPVDPYNPFYEQPLAHTYKLQFQKVLVSFGVRL